MKNTRKTLMLTAKGKGSHIQLPFKGDAKCELFVQPPKKKTVTPIVSASPSLWDFYESEKQTACPFLIYVDLFIRLLTFSKLVS